ncbi:MAG: hypothetical protein AAF514_20545 [Verrucomicrobiota bacterium]
MNAPLIVDPDQIPEGGLDLAGQLAADFFKVDDDLVRPLAPVDYRLHLEIEGSELMVMGELGGEFELLCVRTHKYFHYPLKMQDFAAQIEPENDGSFDLTDQIREDILLALPDYPRIDGEDDLEAEPASKPESTDDRDVWGVLDQITSTKE